MKVLRQSIELPADGSEVWPLLSGVRGWPSFLPTVQAVEAQPGSEGVLAVGSAFRLHQPRLRPAIWTVTAIEAPDAFTWTSSATGLRTVAHHRLQTIAPGRCRLDLEIEFQGPLRGLVFWLAGGLTQDYLRQEAEAFLARVTAASTG